MSPDGAEESRREALSRVLVEDGDRLYALALRTTRDPDLAADAVQEAFASALEKADDFRGESRWGTWLHRIVFNKSIDLLRRRRRYEPLPDEDSDRLTAEDERLARRASWTRAPDEVVWGAETRMAMERALELVDLSALAALGVETARYGALSYGEKAGEYPRSQEVAEAAHLVGFDGLIVPSARFECRNLIIFCDRVAPAALEAINNLGPIDWDEWRNRGS